MIRRVTLAVSILLTVAYPAWGATYLGDFPEDYTKVECYWSTNDATGLSHTRETNGTVSVYKDGNTTQSTAGVTDTEDFDGVTGVHRVLIDTSADAFYAAGSEYVVMLAGGVIDSITFNHPLCQFSIERTGGVLAVLNARRAGPTLEPTTARIKQPASGIVLTVPIKATTGAPLTGLAFNTAGMTAEYCRADGAGACTSITLTGTCSLGTYTSGCFLEKDTTVGLYEIHPPNAAFATGADQVKVTLSGVSGMEPTIISVDLVDVGTSELATTIGTPTDTDVSTDIANVSTDVAAVKSDTAAILLDTGTDGVVMKQSVGTYRKNVAGQREHPIFMRSSSSVQTGLTGATVSVSVSKDGAAFTAVGGTVAEIGNGVYSFSPSQADVNCDTCIYQATADSAVPYIFYIFPAP